MKKLSTLTVLLLVCITGATAQETSTYSAPEDTQPRFNQYGVPVDRYRLHPEAQNDIIVFENVEKGYKFWMDNRIQMDGQTFFGVPDGFTPMMGGVKMRRVRTAFKAQLHYDWYGEIDLNFSNGQFELEDAIIRYEGICGMDIQIGNFKEDFSVEETTTSRYTTFMERAMVVSAFAPGRHIGARVNYYRDWFRISGGVSWQLVDNENTAVNIEELNKSSKGMGANYTAKMVLMPWYYDPDMGLHIAFNASYRSPYKVDDDTPPSSRVYGIDRFSSRNNTAINRLKYLTATIPNIDCDALYGGEFGGYYKGFRFMGEFIWNNTYMTAAATNRTTKTFWGYYAQASYLLFGGINRYDISQSEFTQPTRGRSWGDIELMARWDYLNLNSQDIFGGSGENFTFGIVYHINNNLKCMLNYTYSRNDIYASGGGKYIVGYDSDNNPTTSWQNVSPTSIQGARFHSVGARIELDF